MEKKEQVGLTDIIGKSGRHQRLTFLVAFYSSCFLGTSPVTMDLLAPMVTMYWSWDELNPNKTTFLSNNCHMEDILNLNATSNLSTIDSKLMFWSQYSDNTLTEKLSLVCERSWLVSLANFLSLIGFALGSLMIRLSEIYGRRKFITLASFLSTALALCLCFPVDYTMFAVLFCFFRTFVTQSYVLLFIQAVEVTTPSARAMIGILVASGLICGQAVFVGAAWLLKDWFYSQLFHTFLVAGFLPFVCYMPESPVWLAVRGKYEEAKQVMMKIVKRNGLNTQQMEPTVDLWVQQMKVRCEVETNAEKGTIMDLFKNKRISLYTCSLTFTQISLYVVYNSLVINAETFGSGLYVDLLSANCCSLVAVLVVAALANKISVRIILCLSFLLEGVSCALYPITYGYQLARTIVPVMGRIFVSAITAFGRLYTNEVFPTSVRGVGSGFTVFVGVIVSSPAPFLKELAEHTSVYVPFIIFAGISFASAFVYNLMPETMGKPIVHTVHELKKDTTGKSWRTKVFTISSDK